MRFGVSFPNFGAFAEPEAVVELAVVAERRGWEGFFVWDHILGWDANPVADPWVMLGAVAQVTQTIRIGPMVVAVPRHRPWVVGRQTVTLDRLSGGRMVLGVGIGFPPEEEFGRFGEPTDARSRADMLDESLEIVTGMWTGEPYSHEGIHFHIDQTRFLPVPIQRPRVPIWVAATLPHLRPLRRAARFDGAVPLRADWEEMTPEDTEGVSSYVRRYRTSDAPYDIVIGGGPRSEAGYRELESAGATWYLLGPNPEGESLDDTIGWLDAGPPR